MSWQHKSKSDTYRVKITVPSGENDLECGK